MFCVVESTGILTAVQLEVHPYFESVMSGLRLASFFTLTVLFYTPLLGFFAVYMQLSKIEVL